MSRERKTKLRREVEAILRRSGVAWEIRSGKRHDEVWIGGRMVQTVTRGSGSYDATSNMMAQLRRALRPEA